MRSIKFYLHGTSWDIAWQLINRNSCRTVRRDELGVYNDKKGGAEKQSCERTIHRQRVDERRGPPNIMEGFMVYIRRTVSCLLQHN